MRSRLSPRISSRFGARVAARLSCIVAVGSLVLVACGGTAEANVPSTKVSTAQIEKAYETLFDLSNPAVAPKVAVIQDGKALKSAIVEELTSPLAKEAAGATVQSVKLYSKKGCSSEFLPYPCAKVGYSILLPSLTTGSMTGLSGWAVYQSGKWLVAKITICGLFTLADNGIKPKGC